MPLDEEGAKWSCKPCIRGHRSSKCQHFDRLMIKVPKAGRPLAKCPHPKGKCSCQRECAFMIAIPKGNTCLCRPVYQVPAGMGETVQPQAPVPVAPMTSQPLSTDNSQNSGRRASTFQPTSENFPNAFHSVPGFENRHRENGPFGHLPSYAPFDAGLGIASNSRGAINSGMNTPSFMTQQTFNVAGNSESQQKGSCCTSESQPSSSKQVTSPCGRRSSSPSGTQTSSYQPSLNGTPYTPVSPSQISPWQNFYATGQNNVAPHYAFQHQGFGQPGFVPNYISHEAPNHSKLGFSPQNISNNHNFAQPVMSRPPSGQTQCLGHPTSPSLSKELKHNCGCGDNCQCLGCATHPFNNTTRRHVQEMGLLVTLDGEESSFDGMNGYHDFSSHGNPDTPALDYNFNNFNHFGHDNDPMAVHGTLDNTSQHGSPSADYPSEPHLMVPSEYYTIEYPVKLPGVCSNANASCLCGSDCNCVGCLTHSGHNGVAVEPGMIENHDLTPMSPSAEHEGVAPSHIPVFESTPVHSPNPML